MRRHWEETKSGHQLSNSGEAAAAMVCGLRRWWVGCGLESSDVTS